MAKRMLAIFMIMILCCLSGSAALADGSWTCPNCGQEGNTGNFCGNCAAARPSEEWVCPNCGQVNTTNFCTNCAAAKPSGEQPAEAAPAAVNDQLEQIPGESDHVKVKVQSVSGEPYISNGGDAGRWKPEKAADDPDAGFSPDGGCALVQERFLGFQHHRQGPVSPECPAEKHPGGLYVPGRIQLYGDNGADAAGRYAAPGLAAA